VHRLRIAFGVFTVFTATAAALVAGCGSSSSSSSVSAATYVKSICSAVTPFEKDVQTRSSALNLTTLANATQGKKALQQFLSAVASDTDQVISRLKAAGTPNVSNGDKISKGVVNAFTQLKAAMSRAVSQANALPTNSPQAFKTAAQNLGNTVRSSMTSIGAGLSSLKSADLEKAASKEPACKALGSS
jgi:hypothetical protein